MQQEEKTGLTKYDYLDLLIEEPYKIGHLLGFKDLKNLHNVWIKKMLFAEEDETLLAHRGSYKTTCVSIALAILMILKPTINIIFYRKTDSDVKEVILQVNKILKSELFKHIVKVIYGKELELVEENTFALTTNLYTSTKGHSQLQALGIKASMTGKHADLIFTDDIVTIKDRVSKAERDLVKLQYEELINIKNRGGRMFNTGTPWHKEDAISGMPNVNKYDCYSTGLMSKEEIQRRRSSMTASMFSANYELKHIASEDTMFSNPQFTNDIDLIYDGICHIDASYGGADGSVLTIVKEVNGKFYVLGKRRTGHIDTHISEFLKIVEAFRGGTINCEDNGDKGYLAKDIRNRGHLASTYHESMNKYIKIATYLKKYWQDIIFIDGTDPEYLNEILDYTEQAEHDDSPDSLASIIRLLKGKQGWLF